MENTNWIVLGLGFFAQGLFGARMLVQWILSEKAKKVVSPTIFWQISLLGSFLYSVYGWLRGDFVIIFGQIFSYYIYIWNLNAKRHWKEIYPFFRAIILFMPMVALGFVLYHGDTSFGRLFGHISFSWILIGSIGQIIFTFRFIYQWWYSKARAESLLPFNFWLLSLIGSTIMLVYGIFRKDPVIILSQLGGFVTYTRNIWIGKKQIK
jgi:lipid-A-disaccharide synthase-like uncharacterized protein